MNLEYVSSSRRHDVDIQHWFSTSVDILDQHVLASGCRAHRLDALNHMIAEDGRFEDLDPVVLNALNHMIVGRALRGSRAGRLGALNHSQRLKARQNSRLSRYSFVSRDRTRRFEPKLSEQSSS